jgi:hypothetical protein
MEDLEGLGASNASLLKSEAIQPVKHVLDLAFTQ